VGGTKGTEGDGRKVKKESKERRKVTLIFISWVTMPRVEADVEGEARTFSLLP
jgi:hypothetical protein